jgi:hypothetical protein
MNFLHPVKQGTLDNKVVVINNEQKERELLLSLNVTMPSAIRSIDMGNQPFSVILDESTDISVTKYLCVCVRYYSESNRKIFNRFLGSRPHRSGEVYFRYTLCCSERIFDETKFKN